MEILKPGPRITSADIGALEERFGLTFPDDYRDFLMCHNGGKPKPPTVRVPSHDEGVFDVHVLFGLTRAIEADNVEWNARLETSFVGQHLLPIGGTDTSDLLLLKVAGDGGVFFWDSMAENQAHAVHFVAPSFEEFLAGLFEGPPE